MTNRQKARGEVLPDRSWKEAGIFAGVVSEVSELSVAGSAV